MYDLLVIGGGPGGYAAAVRAAQLGLNTALVERDRLGGICLTLGCIPSKSMLRSGEVISLIQTAEAFGLTPQAGLDPRADYQAVVARREQIVAQLVRGLTTLLKANGVIVLPGIARLTGPHAAEVLSDNETRAVEFEHLIVATGSRATALPIPGATLPGVIDSDAAFSLTAPPARAVIVGAGAVGVEWADIWNAFGTEVTLLEQMPQLVPTEEPEIARELQRAFTRKGITCHTSVRVQEIRPSGQSLEVVSTPCDVPIPPPSQGPEASGAGLVLSADVVLIAVGRRPNVEGLDLEAAGVTPDRTGIPTDAHMRTAVPHIFAIGDVTGRSLLAHAAIHQGLIAAETIAGHSSEGFEARLVPAAIFTHPEIASVGLRERDAAPQGLSVRVGRFPFAASGRAAASGQAEGFVKVLAEETSGRLLGAHIIGASAGDLIGEAALAIRLGATVQDVASTIHVHPTFSEALQEACAVAAGKPLHVAPRRSSLPVDGGGRGERVNILRLSRSEPNTRQSPPPLRLNAIWLGRQPYDETHALQIQTRDEVIAGQAGPTILLVEHEPVIAFGRRRIMEDLRLSLEELETAGIAVRFTERGGRATYHGPGQLVAYPILRLRSVAPTLPHYVWGIEETIIRALGQSGVKAIRDPSDAGQRGVWVEGAKIASIGLAVTRGVCWHGFSININPDPAHLAAVCGCGLDSPVCAIADLADPPSLPSLAATVARTFAEVFSLPLSENAPPPGASRLRA